MGGTGSVVKGIKIINIDPYKLNEIISSKFRSTNRRLNISRCDREPVSQTARNVYVLESKCRNLRFDRPCR